MPRLVKKYINHFGIDVKSTDLNRRDEFASDLRNSQNRKTSGIEKRRGYQAHGASSGGHGLFTYNRVDPTTAKDEPELLSVSDKLHKRLTSTLNVTYTGSEAVAYISIYFSPTADEYLCQVQEGVTLVGTFSLGKGFDEASIKTIDSLRSDIDSLTDFTATVLGATSTPAAFIEVVTDHDLVDGDYSGVASYWLDVNTTIAAPFAGSETNKDDENFENVSSTQLRNVIYFTNGYDYVQKYDGQTLYRAGLPRPLTPTSALNGTGIIPAGTNYQHTIRYVQKDNGGNFIEGNDARVDPTLLLSNVGLDSFDVTVDNIQDGTGFNTNCAIVAGAQGPVNTITVDDGSGGSHTMKVGDTAYFYDSVSASYVEREVTSVAAGTITVAGSAVTVSDNAVISNNLRIEIYRNETSGVTPTTFFLVEEIPNDSFAATQTYNDNTPDSALGREYIQPLVDRSPPPKGRYISAFRENMIIAGNLETPHTVYYSDIIHPEYFPAGLQINSFDVHTTSGDIITGIAPNNEFFLIFKKKTIYTVNGDIVSGTIQVQQLTTDVGCVAHASIQEARGTLFFLSDRGPYMITGGQLPQQMGQGRVEPLFDGRDMIVENKLVLFNTASLSSDQIFKEKRAVAVNDRDAEQYILYVPAESEISGEVYSNTNARIFMYDYHFDAFHIWDSMDMSGGATTFEGNLYFQERRYSSFNTSVDHILYRRHNTGEGQDYQDNDVPIDWNYKPQWEALGEPSVLKKFLRLQLFAFEQTRNNFNEVTIETEANYIRDGVVSTFVIDQGGGGYGVSPYGTTGYGDSDLPFQKHKLRNTRFRSMRVVFRNNNPQENVIVPGWELEVEAPFAPAFKN